MSNQFGNSIDTNILDNVPTNTLQKILNYSELYSKTDINFQNSCINKFNLNSMLLSNIENNIENYNIKSYLNKKRYNFCLNNNIKNYNEKKIIDKYNNFKNIVEQNDFTNELENDEIMRNYVTFNNLNNLFKEKINVEKCEEIIKNDYDKKFENNTNYKYVNPYIVNNNNNNNNNNNHNIFLNLQNIFQFQINDENGSNNLSLFEENNPVEDSYSIEDNNSFENSENTFSGSDNNLLSNNNNNDNNNNNNDNNNDNNNNNNNNNDNNDNNI